jgi:signal peptidase II
MVDIRLKAYGAAAAWVVLDRITKRLIETRLSFTDSVRVIPGFFDIIRAQNQGAAFGLFNDSSFEWRTVALVLVSAVAVVVMSILLWNARRLDGRVVAGLALVLGGAAGNEIDRVSSGRVTDFLLFYIGPYQWPAFNVADSGIVIGCGLLLLDMLRPKRQAANVP